MLAAIEAANRERQKSVLADFDGLLAQGKAQAVVTAAVLAKLDELIAASNAQEKAYAQILAALAETNVRLSASHIDHPANFIPPTLDWDTVQAIAAHNLESTKDMPEHLKEIYR